MEPQRTLTLNLKRKWFEQVASGAKAEEYRLVNDYWKKRLEDREYDKIIIALGYPRREDQNRRIQFPWRGYEIKTIISEEWDNVPQTVFVIKLEKG